MSDYAELQVTTNFSFLRGASHPWELVRQAAALGHRVIAVTDRNTLAGIVRAHVAARDAGLRLVIGCRLDLTEDEAATAEAPSASLLCYPTDRTAYGRLSRLLTLGKRRAAKGECRLDWPDILAHGAGQIFALLPPDRIDSALAERLRSLVRRFPGHVYLAASHLYRGDEARRFARLAALAAETGAPLLAVNDVHYHEPGRRLLQDVLACIRWGCTIEQAGLRLAAHAERHLKPAAEMARLFRHHPDAVARTVGIAERCRFSLGELSYEYPDEATTEGRTAQQELVFRTWEGAARRYPEGIPDKVRGALVHELALIDELNYAPYFLTVWDIVRFAQSKAILCQGRGSAANSAVCFCLGVTAIDPAKFDLLFERFVSAARNEPPDIDVDFEHERREEVIQYVYQKYGREHAGLTAVVISYRGRSAVRDVGKAMGLSEDMVTALTRDYRRWGHPDVTKEHFREIGVDPDAPGVVQTMRFASEIQGFPRHLSQHVGGFVITRGLLCDVVPIENAAMADRTVIEWDKDDLDALGILKVDVLALGMLTCIRKAFDLIALHYGQRFEIATVPQDDPAVYEMLQKADALGVFQVESRAQLSMLPRLKPKEFYDLVIEVAIVRPGPIQGGMVHPYLRRREGKEPVAYPSPALEGVLRKTLGVPLFQEQAMNIAIVGAGFTPEDADRLRRSMASFKRNGDIAKFRDKFIDGLIANGCTRDFATRCFDQIEGFSTYGFPESHAASFAVLVYVSAWLKRHYPAVFAAALLNSQPMGFYAPAQLVRDAREHKVDAREADVNKSDWDCTLEKKPDDTVALRLGLRQIVGFSADSARKLMDKRGAGYADPHAVWRRAGLAPAALEVLARADAWRSMGLGRREALWAIRALGAAPLPLFAALDSGVVSETTEPAVALPAMTPAEAVVDDYRSLHLTLREHPLSFLRDGLMRLGAMPAKHLADIPAGGWVTVAGLVLVRQRPGSAKGVIFVTLEDETGIANLIVYSDVFERNRRILLGARLMGATGRVERQGAVVHVMARHLHDWTALLHALTALPDHAVLARADEVKRLGQDPRGLPVASRDFH